MNRRTASLLILCLGLASLVACTVFVIRDVSAYQQLVRNDFRASCRRRTITFETFAEQWIVHDQLDSLENATRFLVMGDGLYVDISVQGEQLLLERDEDRSIPEWPTDELAPGTMIVNDLEDGGVEVAVPIVRSGYPDHVYGLLRIGYSGHYAVALVRGRAWKTAGTGFGVWLAVIAAVILAAWIAGRLRREDQKNPSILRCGTLEIDVQACRTTLNGVVLDLTPKLYELLLLFVKTQGAILSDQDILDAVWPDSTYAASPDVKQHVYLLRQKLAVAHADPKSVIVNEKGFGYRLEPPTNESELSVD